jgi:hypothetical protein
MAEGMSIYFVDGWDGLAGKVILRAWRDKEKAEADLKRMRAKREGVYAKLVARKIDDAKATRVYVVDGRDEASGKSILHAFTDQAKAKARLQRLLEREPDTSYLYAGVASCTIR